MGIAVEMPAVPIIDYGTAPTIYASQTADISINRADGTAQFSLTQKVRNADGVWENRLVAVLIMPLGAIMPAVHATIAAIAAREQVAEAMLSLVQ